MFVVTVDLRVKPGQHQVLEKTYLESFRPAISAQAGFVATQLLRSDADDGDYHLGLAFDHQASQKKWVATDLHQQVWPLIVNLCTENFIKRYHTV